MPCHHRQLEIWQLVSPNDQCQRDGMLSDDGARKRYVWVSPWVRPVTALPFGWQISIIYFFESWHRGVHEKSGWDVSKHSPVADMWHVISWSAFVKIWHLVAMATHFPLLSYRFDTSHPDFSWTQDASFSKYVVEIVTPNGTDDQIFRVWPMD